MGEQNVKLQLSSSEPVGCQEYKRQHEIHSLPAAIAYDGEANTDCFFRSSIRRDGDSKTDFTAVLRGRPLNGRTLKIPDGYIGLVASEHEQETFGGETLKTVHATSHFNEMTYWNLDKKPSDEDNFSQALDVLDLASALHTPCESLTRMTSTESQGSLQPSQ